MVFVHAATLFGDTYPLERAIAIHYEYHRQKADEYGVAGGGMDSATNKVRSMSAVLLIFYLIPLAVMYSATHFERFDESRQCLNGHRVSPLAKFREECGAQVIESTQGIRPLMVWREQSFSPN